MKLEKGREGRLINVLPLARKIVSLLSKQSEEGQATTMKLVADHLKGQVNLGEARKRRSKQKTRSQAPAKKVAKKKASPKKTTRKATPVGAAEEEAPEI